MNDLGDVFLTVPLARNGRILGARLCLSRCTWRLSCDRLWFGLSLGPEIFTAALERKVVHLRPWRQSLTHPLSILAWCQYMDDASGAGRSWLSTIIASAGWLFHATVDGWGISAKKTFWLPAYKLKV
jgi:hypothetical protein